MAFRTGHRPDAPAVVDARIGLHAHPEIGAMRAGTLPLKTTNRAKLWGIWNQSDVGGCEGCGHSTGITLRLALAGTPLAQPVSNVGLYYGALVVDRVPSLDGSLPKLFDTGTMPSSILSAAGAWGTAGASLWGQQPMSSQTMYLNPSANPGDADYQALREPAPEQLYAESSFKLKGAYFVQTQAMQRLVDILTVLAAGRPMTMSLPASGSDFQSYSGGVMGWPSGPVDHCNALLDYEWTGTQEQFDAFLAGAPGLDQYLIGHAVNSWDVTWGEADAVASQSGGLYRVDRSFLDQLADPCVLDVVRA